MYTSFRRSEERATAGEGKSDEEEEEDEPRGPHRPPPPIPPVEHGLETELDLTSGLALPDHYKNALLSGMTLLNFPLQYVLENNIFSWHAAPQTRQRRRCTPCPRTRSGAPARSARGRQRGCAQPRWLRRTPKKLATRYKIRQQRVMAILALKDIERQWEAKGYNLFDDLAEDIEAGSGVVQEGVGEKHYVFENPEPSFEVIHDGLPESRRPAAAASAQGRAEAQEEMRVAEFAERLAINMGRLAAGLWKPSRARVAPPRPKEGWSLLVTPLGEQRAPFVATPDGTPRELTQTEAEYQAIRKVKPRRLADVE